MNDPHWTDADIERAAQALWWLDEDEDDYDNDGRYRCRSWRLGMTKEQMWLTWPQTRKETSIEGAEHSREEYRAQVKRVIAALRGEPTGNPAPPELVQRAPAA